MAADRHPWEGRAVEEFDYSAMAERARIEAEHIKAGLEAMKQRGPVGLDDRAQILLLEEEYMEQCSLYRLFCRKAEERRKDETD